MSRRTSTLVAFGGVVLMTAVAVAATDHPVVQKDRSFSVRTLSVRAGDRVVFTNADPMTHNVYSLTEGLAFDLRSQAPGQSDTVTFSRPGTALVECAIHPKMKLQVVVTP